MNLITKHGYTSFMLTLIAGYSWGQNKDKETLARGKGSLMHDVNIKLPRFSTSWNFLVINTFLCSRLILVFLSGIGLAQAERQISSYQNFTAVISDDQQCSSTVAVTVKHPKQNAFIEQKEALQRLLAGVRISYNMECPQAKAIHIVGIAGGSRVYNGVLASSTDWVLVETQPQNKVVSVTKKTAIEQSFVKKATHQNKGVSKCDLLASNSGDPDKKAPGVVFDQLIAKEAIKQCNAAIKKSPTQGRFYYQLGRALEKDGQMTQALIAYEKALDLSYPQAHLNLGLLMTNLKQYKSAINHYNILANTGHARAMLELCGVYETLGDKPRSDFWLRKAAENNDPDAIRILREESVDSVLNFLRM